MISADGWVQGVRVLPGNSWQVNVGRNQIRGLVAHSAEGYASTLLNPASPYGYKGNHSWHFTNLKDGSLIQHFSVYQQTWHGNMLNPFTIGVENEGTSDQPEIPTQFEPLTDPQIDNLVFLSKEIAALKGYTRYARFTGVDDPSAFLLYEHNQAVLFGGSSTECPSGRIPWDVILAKLAPTPLHVAEVRESGNLLYVKFKGTGTISIHDGDEWVLAAADPAASFGSGTYPILPPHL